MATIESCENDVKIIELTVDVTNHSEDILKLLGVIRSSWKKDDLTYDVAVNSALYGIKVEDEMLVNYDKEKGIQMQSE